MRILQLTPQFPWPTYQGTTLRNFNILKQLAQRHELHLFSILDAGDEPNAGPVPELCASISTAPAPARSTGQRLRDLMTTASPDMARRLWSRQAAATLRDVAQSLRPDILLIEGIEMAPYFFHLRAAGLDAKKSIYDAHNAETLLQQRAARADIQRPKRWPAALYSGIQTQKLRRYEQNLTRSVTGIAAVSQPDATFLRNLAPQTPIEIVTNGVDLALYHPHEPFAPIFDRPGPHLVFTGKMDFRPNVDAALWFANQVMPHLRTAGIDAHFWIVGRNPHPRLKTLLRRNDVSITGQVPDVRPYIVQADVYVVPLLAGGGTRFKILEALALAKAVTSTHLGADGIPVQHDQHLTLADAPDAFAQQVARLLQDTQLTIRLGQNGRDFIQQHFSWDAIVPRLERLF
jgi:sugar transferase (PEP-CTERM/EpsH1 system associated)